MGGFVGVGGYNPLVTLRYLDFAKLTNRKRPFPRSPLDGFTHTHQPWRPGALFDAASIRYLIRSIPMQRSDLELVGRYPDPARLHDGLYLYENEHALPRAYLSYRTRLAEGFGAYAELVAAGFDARTGSIVEGDAPVLDGPEEITPVVRVDVQPELLHFDIAPVRPAVLVVTDAWYPGWTARVDGVELPVFRVNALFRGVAVPANARRVEMRFAPLSFRIGALVSLAALIGILALGFVPALRRIARPG